MWQRLVRLAPLTSVAFVGLIVAAIFASPNSPKSSAGGAKVISFFRAHQNGQKASAYLVAASVVAGFFFFGALRARLRRHPDTEALASIAFGGAIMFGTAAVIAAGTTLALADQPSRLTPDSATTLNLLQNDLVSYIFPVGMAVLTLATGAAVLRSRSLPAWEGIAALVLGVVCLTPLFFLGFLLIGAWVLTIGITMYLRPIVTVQLPDVPNQPATAVPASRSNQPA